jgi:hypothetical protein
VAADRAPHPLLERYHAAAAGHFPDVDGLAEVVPPVGEGIECVAEFTGHSVIATALPAEEVLGWGVDGFGASMKPSVLTRLAGPGGWVGVIDATMVGTGRGHDVDLPARDDLEHHHRVRYARRLRTGVRVYGDERGLVTLAWGLAGRLELSVEASPAGQGRGWGRSLIHDALALVPDGAPVFAAVAPGNARSLRAFLGCGFVPIGSEVVIQPARVRPVRDGA